MFDFLRDVNAIINDFDIKKIEDERRKPQTERSFIPPGVRSIIITLGIVYLGVAAINIFITVKYNFSFVILKYAFLVLLDLIILVSVLIEKNSAERLAVVCIAIFLSVNFLSASL